MNENQTIYSFDSTFSVSGELFETEKYRELYAAMLDSASGKKFVSRGAGVSYPLASAGENVRSIVSLQFNRILEFDSSSGVVKVESGISIGKLLKFLSKRGWWLPVMPGHPSITVGGCVAANVHGKSQYHSGLFEDCVRELEIFHPTQGKKKLSKESPLFEFVCGGFGLTGHILTVSIQCKQLAGKSLLKRAIPTANLFESIEIMLTEKDHYDHVYSWNNLNCKGDHFGKGYVYCEKFESEPAKDISEFHVLAMAPRKGLLDQLLSRTLQSQISRVYALKERISPAQVRMGILAGAFPINGKEIYHRLFGLAGLLESQIIIPHDQLRPVIQKLAKSIAQSQVKISLGSLKIFRGRQTNLNFRKDGICLALNAPNSLQTLELFKQVDAICIEHNCLPNIAKDSRLSAAVIRSTYPEFERFQNGIKNFDPEGRIHSALKARLQL